MTKTKAVIYAPVSTLSGYGSRSRDIVKSLIELYGEEWDIKIMSCGWGNLPTDFIDNNPEWEFLNEYILKENLTYQPDLMFWITIPPEAQPIGKWNCLITAGIETNICAPQWIEGVNRMDLTLVSSQHGKDVFLNSQFDKQDSNTKQIVGKLKVEKPVEVLFEGFSEEIYKYLSALNPSSIIKQELDIIKEKFCFLFTGHWLPGMLGEDRKNVGLLVKLFLETFKNKKDKPALILKTMGGPTSIVDRNEILLKIAQIRQSVNSKILPNIYVLHGEITDEQMNELYNHSKVKAMVSFTKGEGFGRPLLEFTQSKKPIIASNWSGHIDYLDAEFASLVPGQLTPIHNSAQIKDTLIEGSSWFSPDLGQSSSILKDYFENYKKYKDNGPRLAYKCKENFTFNKMKETLKNILSEKMVLPYNLKLPTLRKV